MISFQIHEHCHRLKCAGVGLIHFAASRQVSVKGDEMKLCVSQKGNYFSSEDLSLHHPACCCQGIDMLLAV